MVHFGPYPADAKPQRGPRLAARLRGALRTYASEPAGRTLKTMSKKKDPNKYPRGWDAKKVRELAGHYETQPDADAAAEDERRLCRRALHHDRGPQRTGPQGTEAHRPPRELTAPSFALCPEVT
jgi:hypothetical protein